MPRSARVNPKPVNADRIRQLVAQGVAYRDVAERLGVSRSVVSRVARGAYPERVCNRCNVRRSVTEPRCFACGGAEFHEEGRK